MYAKTEGDDRAAADPKARGTCPICGAPVMAKCGAMVVWHWAHESLEDCDEWAEPDSSWHRAWMDNAPPDRREVVMGKHRADVVTASGHVLELQHSGISSEMIHAREEHYGRMAWLFDAREARLENRLDIRYHQGRSPTFRWKHPRKTIGCCVKPVMLDIGNNLVLRICAIHFTGMCGGWGRVIRAEKVRDWIRGTPQLEHVHVEYPAGPGEAEMVRTAKLHQDEFQRTGKRTVFGTNSFILR